MENEKPKEEKSEPLNEKEGNKEDSGEKWLYISIFLIIFILAFIIGIIVITSTKKFKKGGSNNDNNENEEFIWKPQGERIKTPWAEQVKPENVWPEYPRPQMVRDEWTNLNGFWEYAITKKEFLKPNKADGQILVPFPIESSLSGVMKTVNEKQNLWYKKEVNIKGEWKKKKHLLLHFGAVDYITDVFINDVIVGHHVGGYSPFYFDIYKYIDFNKHSFTIIVKVFDPSNKGYQSVGKQTLTPDGIWYTPSTGIWQTVWLESVNEYYIDKIDMNSDFDNKVLKITTHLNTDKQLPLTVRILYDQEVIVTDKNHVANSELNLEIKGNNFHPWSPDSPRLYDIQIEVHSEDKQETYDIIKSYAAIRKITAERDSNDIMRFKLNNKVVFHMGTLDQGYWPDGLYTPPNEEAMIYDIKKLKEMGFNTIRKHAKVESARYYYYCDKIGMFVWQDMPSGDIGGNNWNPREMNGGTDKGRSQESKDNYFHEWEQIIDFGKFFPSIVVWTPFNEAWGQFETERASNFTREHDPTRLINSASGGNHRKCGDILDLHNYPEPQYFLNESSEVNVLGEYGGLGLELKGHTWKDDNWGYRVYQSVDEITYYFVDYIKMLEGFAKEGFSGAIYTQTTDCESEINGLITYDRKEMKVFIPQVREAIVELIRDNSEQ